MKVDSILGEVEAWSRQARVNVRKGRFERAITFDLTVDRDQNFT
jgi:hypothetical protein